MTLFAERARFEIGTLPSARTRVQSRPPLFRGHNFTDRYASAEPPDPAQLRIGVEVSLSAVSSPGRDSIRRTPNAYYPLHLIVSQPRSEQERGTTDVLIWRIKLLWSDEASVLRGLISSLRWSTSRSPAKQSPIVGGPRG